MRMNIKNTIIAAMALLASVSCVDDRNNFMVDDSFGFNHAKEEAVITYPIYGGKYDLAIIKSGKGLVEADVKISGSEFDLIKYNDSHKESAKSFVAFSKDLYNFSETTVHFNAEDVTKNVTVLWEPADLAAKMTETDKYDYIIPVRISSSDLIVNEGREYVLLNLKQVNFSVVQEKINQTLELNKPIKVNSQIVLKTDLAIPSDDIVVEFEVDKTLVEAYNEANGTSYTIAPEGAVTFPSNSTVIAKGMTEGYFDIIFDSSVFFNEDGVTPNEELAKEYLVPVKVNKMSVDGLLLGNTVTYILVKAQIPLPPALFERVWGFYGDTALDKGWSVRAGVESLDGADRSLTVDDSFVYIPQTTGGEANIHKFNLLTGEYAGKLPVSSNMNVGTHSVSCARMIKNTDSSVNGGKDILLVGNLALGGEYYRLYAYHNGTDKEPVMVVNTSLARRFGDKFSAVGTYQDGRIWVRSNDNVALTGYYVVNDKYAAGTAKPEDNWIVAAAIGKLNDHSNIGELYWYPSESSARQPYCLISSTSNNGLSLYSGCENAAGEGSQQDNSTLVATYPALAMTFGYDFFEVNGNHYIAFTKKIDEFNKKAAVQVIKGAGSTLESLKETLDAYPDNIVFEAPLQDEFDITIDGVAGNNTVCDCEVRKIGNDVYLVAMSQRTGLSVFKFNHDFVIE